MISPGYPAKDLQMVLIFSLGKEELCYSGTALLFRHNSMASKVKKGE